jgi:TusA-related sulfurtransferase
MTLAINPETKVGELLDAYPEAESVLVELAPRFKALSNPVLRRTVARVTTLEQAARVGGIRVSAMIMALRGALGVGGDTIEDGEEWSGEEAPPWVRDAVPTAALDAGALLDAGTTPVGEASRRLAEMAGGQVLKIDSPFIPAPLVDALRAKGHAVHAQPNDQGAWEVWIQKS